jgi:PadR family transcriptional regulator PadR
MADVLGAFEQAILLSVVRLGGDAYGRAVLKEVQSRLKRDVSAGALYTTLDRLEKRALLRSRLEPGSVARAGRPRRFYSVTGAGARALNESRATVDNIWRGVGWPLKGGT